MLRRGINQAGIVSHKFTRRQLGEDVVVKTTDLLLPWPSPSEKWEDIKTEKQELAKCFDERLSS